VDKVKRNTRCKNGFDGYAGASFCKPAYAGQFGNIFKTLAVNNQMALVPFFLDGVAGKQHLNLPDRLTLQQKVYKVIADNVWPIIQKLL